MMRTKNPNEDSGKYVNGVYTTKNGFSGSGLNCPKGTRLYRTDVTCPIFFMPKDRGETEDFEMITQDVCPGVMPYYAVSNYGRIMNVNSGKIMKPNYRPNGYEYYCLAAEGTKTGQKKYNCNRIVMQTFEPVEHPENYQVNHIDGDKSHNYINKTMPDGSIRSNIEWTTRSENIQHAHDTGLNNPYAGNFTAREISTIRNLRDQGWSFGRINKLYPSVSYATIQAICTNVLYRDSNYTPKKYDPYNDVSNNSYLKVSNKDAEMIRKLNKLGYKNKSIKELFFPNVSLSTISDIIRGITHNSSRE